MKGEGVFVHSAPRWLALLAVGIFAGVVALSPSPVEASPVAPRDYEPALNYWLEVDDLVVPYRWFSLYVMPGEELSLGVRYAGDRSFSLEPDTSLVSTGSNRWRWTAPDEVGRVQLTLRPDDGTDPMHLNVFVMRPRSEVVDGTLNGYRIGEYPQQPLGGRDVYLPPAGLIEVTEDMEDIRISPHFTLGQFLCKQPSGYPKYMVLRESLILKLELILEKLNEEGHDVEGFEILSGYRTPYYNEAIGNVPYSRHLWGGAADIYIDDGRPRGRMDDLTEDGSSSWRDARWLADFINEHFPLPEIPELDHIQGGIGVYGSNQVRGPFVHVDARGFPAEWTGSGVPD